MPDRKTLLLAQVLITFTMAALMSGIMSLIAMGPTAEWLRAWPVQFIIAWPIAFVLTQFASKIAFSLARKIMDSLARKIMDNRAAQPFALKA